MRLKKKLQVQSATEITGDFPRFDGLRLKSRWYHPAALCFPELARQVAILAVRHSRVAPVYL
jgi:hypothetical protein